MQPPFEVWALEWSSVNSGVRQSIHETLVFERRLYRAVGKKLICN